jgi:DNA-binding MarR family transcriptional regulator
MVYRRTIVRGGRLATLRTGQDITVHKTTSGPHGPHMELEGVDPLSTRVFGAFMKALHLHRQAVTKALTSQGRNFSQAGCLRVVAENDGISQRDLAETLHLSRPSVTTMLHAMEDEGAIIRRPDARDRRLTRVYLTDSGRALEQGMRSGLADYVNRTIGSMSKPDRETLEDLLGKLAESIATTLVDSPAEEGTA